MPDGGYTLTRKDGVQAAAMLDELAGVYVPAYAEPPYEPHLMFSREEFIARTTRQTAKEGFVLVAARTGEGELAGFSFGLPFEAGGWWRDVSGAAPPPQFVDAQKFAVIELVVAARHRGRGLSRRLIESLLEGRPERYATLLAQPDAPARQIYAHWGWQKVADVQSYPGGDIDDVLVLPLQRP